MKFLTLELNYITNINPKFTLNTEKYNALSSFEFFIFFFTLNYFFKKNKEKNVNLTKIIFFIKPKKKKVITYLRAPYRYKLAKNQVRFNRFFINIKFIFKQPICEYTYMNNITHAGFVLKKNLIKLSTNLSNLVSFKITWHIRLTNFFKIKY